MKSNKCFKGNLYDIKKGNGESVRILSSNKVSALKKFNTLFASKNSGEIKIKLKEKNKTICR